MVKLTEKQSEILDCIKRFIASHGYPPTVREICNIKGISSPATVQVHLNKLLEKNVIKRDTKRNRAIELLVDNEYVSGYDSVIRVPLLNRNDFFEISCSFVPKNKDFCAYVMESDLSTKNILKDDVLIIQRQKSFDINDIVVYMDDSDVVIKISDGKSIKNVIGKVIGLYRKI